jgi:signal transduction histidine kinase
MKSNQPQIDSGIEKGDAWNRWQWIWIVTYFATLSFSLWGALLDQDLQPGEQPLFWSLSIIMALTQLGIFYLDQYRGGARENWKTALVLFAIQIACWYVLVFRDPIFYIHLFSLFAQVNSGLPRRLGLVGNIVLTLGIAIPQFARFGFSWLTLGLYIVMGGVSLGFGWWIDGIIKQSADRRDLLEQLRQTQRELAALERREGVLEERSRLARDNQKIGHHIQQAEAVARDGLHQARQVVNDLRPQVLTQSDTLGKALRKEAEKWESHSGVPVLTEITGHEIQLHPAVEVSLLRALQEALANIAKHAQATAVQVTLSYIGEQVILDISDNGRGFQTNDPTSNGGGFGLQAMRERIAEIQGELHIESEPGEGVNVAIVVPLSGN